VNLKEKGNLGHKNATGVSKKDRKTETNGVPVAMEPEEIHWERRVPEVRRGMGSGWCRRKGLKEGGGAIETFGV